MEKGGRYGGRGFLKNPPQPHMCVQDCLVGSDEPCFVNILSWEKILMPAPPTDVIPLFGGIKIKNTSLNSLSCTDLYEGIKDGKQPLIFAVCTNTVILKQSGKNTTDLNERDAFISVILDFVEAMNVGIQFQHKFKILPDRDVVGELKDIWFIIQSKREQDKTEERNLTEKLKDSSNGHWNHRDTDMGRKQSGTKALRLDQYAGKVLYTPQSSCKEISYYVSNVSQNSESQQISEKNLNRELQNSRKERTYWSREDFPVRRPSTSRPSHSPRSIQQLLPPSFSETIQMKAREVKSAAMNRKNKTDVASQIFPTVHITDNKLITPFQTADRTENTFWKHSLASDPKSPSNESVQGTSTPENSTSPVQNSYESELAMCNQLWHGITTEFLPSLDARRNMSKVGLHVRAGGTTTSTSELNDTCNSELVKNDLMTAAEANGAELTGMLEETLGKQESSLAKTLAVFDSMSIVQNCLNVDAAEVDPAGDMLPHISYNISSEKLLSNGGFTAFVPGIGVITQPKKCNQNLSGFTDYLRDQIILRSQFSNEVNKNTDFAETSSDVDQKKAEAAQNAEHCAVADSNKNVNA